MGDTAKPKTYERDKYEKYKDKQSEYYRSYYEDHKDEYRLRSKAWREKNKGPPKKMGRPRKYAVNKDVVVEQPTKPEIITISPNNDFGAQNDNV